jgi:glycosyltransferase involved in cell wall biosynthesis
VTVLSIVMPVYNEAETLCGALSRTVREARLAGVPFEVVVVDDGSRDRTASLLARPQEPEVRVVTHRSNQGLGAAVATGMQTAGGTFCIVAPVDNPHPAHTLVRFLQAATEADLVLGWRPSRPGYSPLMRFNSGLYHLALRLVCALPYRDVNWIHLYRRDRFLDLPTRFHGVVAAAEVVLRARARGYRIREIPCPMEVRRRGIPSASRPRIMLATLVDLCRLLWGWRSL